METIQLTPAEIELIENKRKQDLLEAEAQELREKARREKDIELYEKAIAKELRDAENQNIAANNFLEALGEGWEALRVPKTGHKEIKSISTEEIHWQKDYQYQKVTLVKGNYEVEVSEHITYSNDRWGKATNHGYKMYLRGPGIDYSYSNSYPLKSAASVNKKIDGIIAEAKAKAESKAKKLSATQTNAEKIKAEYPTALVETIRDSERVQVSSSRHEYREINVIRVRFANGVSIRFKVYEDGSMARLAVDFGEVAKESYKLMKALSSMNVNF